MGIKAEWPFSSGSNTGLKLACCVLEQELARSMMLLHEKADEWQIDAEKIVVQGCSAGGHLAASLGMFWDRDFLAEKMGLKITEKKILRPYGMLLCYPVITSGEFAHRGSFENLLGEREKELEKEVADLREEVEILKKAAAFLADVKRG